MLRTVKTIFSEYFISKGILTHQAWEELLEKFFSYEGDFISFIVDKDLSSEEELLSLLSRELNIEFISLKDFALDKEVIAKIPIRIAAYYKFIPLEIKNRNLRLAVSCPFDIKAQDEIRTHLGYDVSFVLARKADIADTLQKAYGVGAQTMEKITSASKGKAAYSKTERVERLENIEELAEDASVIRLVNEIIFEAYKKRATDIHIEPYRDDVAIRYRIDGVLYDVAVSGDVKHFFAPIISRIKIMCNLDIVERRLPQDGRAIVKTQEQPLDLRISTLPTPYGESMVIRILPTKILYSLESLGLSQDYLNILEGLIVKPHGIIFVTGPTGSGKTTSLYACLNKINTRNRKIITLEDPVEYEMSGMTQIQMQPEIGLDFSRGLRSVLRHDPDIIMVGEVRDLETAEIAIRVALTGHLIFSTLHTNDAASGITRLVDIGIEPYLVASSVEAFIAQRLVRVLCPHCKFEDKDYSQALKARMAAALKMESPEEIKVFKAKGCHECNGTGFYGRTAIYEMLLVDDTIKELILKRASAGEIKRAARFKNMRTLFQDGLYKIIAGETTPEEVLRVVTTDEAIFETKEELPVGQSADHGQTFKENNRVYERLNAHVNVRYRVITNKDEINDKDVDFNQFSISKNISAGGTAFAASEELVANTVLRLQIDLPDQGPPIRCFARVAWCKEAQPGRYMIGICFLDLTGSERQRLDAYVVS